MTRSDFSTVHNNHAERSYFSFWKERGCFCITAVPPPPHPHQTAHSSYPIGSLPYRNIRSSPLLVVREDGGRRELELSLLRMAKWKKGRVTESDAVYAIQIQQFKKTGNIEKEKLTAVVIQTPLSKSHFLSIWTASLTCTVCPLETFTSAFPGGRGNFVGSRGLIRVLMWGSGATGLWQTGCHFNLFSF